MLPFSAPATVNGVRGEGPYARTGCLREGGVMGQRWAPPGPCLPGPVAGLLLPAAVQLHGVRRGTQHAVHRYGRHAEGQEGHALCPRPRPTIPQWVRGDMGGGRAFFKVVPPGGGLVRPTQTSRAQGLGDPKGPCGSSGWGGWNICQNSARMDTFGGNSSKIVKNIFRTIISPRMRKMCFFYISVTFDPKIMSPACFLACLQFFFRRVFSEG